MKACTQKLYSVLVGDIISKEEPTWSNDAQRGEAGQSAAWRCTEQVVNSQGRQGYTQFAIASPHILYACATLHEHLLREVQWTLFIASNE
jgi:hypothetical protein